MFRLFGISFETDKGLKFEYIFIVKTLCPWTLHNWMFLWEESTEVLIVWHDHFTSMCEYCCWLKLILKTTIDINFDNWSKHNDLLTLYQWLNKSWRCLQFVSKLNRWQLDDSDNLGMSVTVMRNDSNWWHTMIALRDVFRLDPWSLDMSWEDSLTS